MEKVNFEREEYVKRIIGDCQSLIRREAEDFLRKVIEDGYLERSKKFWRRDYSSIGNYLNSVKQAKQDWKNCLGDFSDYYSEQFNPEIEKIYEDEKKEIFYISIEIYKGMRGYGLLGYPKNMKKASPLIIAQHGIGSSPFHVFGFYGSEGYYHSYGSKLLDENYVVIAPFNITDSQPRARIQRLCLLLGNEVAASKKNLTHQHKAPCLLSLLQLHFLRYFPQLLLSRALLPYIVQSLMQYLIFLIYHLKGLQDYQKNLFA